MAKKRVQVGQFQKRAQLQSVARLVDQYVAPPKTNRQAQIASALEQAIPALQKYQEDQLEKDLNEVESKVLKEVNSGNLKSLLSDYDEYREGTDLVRNTYAKKRYEETIAPLAARQVGSELALRYKDSKYAQSTNPNDYQKFLNENLDDIIGQYSGSFSESTGGLADFQRSINPYINQFQQRFTEEAIRNNKDEETNKLQVKLSEVTSPEEAREWLQEAKATGILTNMEIDTIIFNQAQSEISGIDGKFSNATFNAFKDLKVGNTGQIYGKKFTEGSGLSGKVIEKYSDEDITYKQRRYDQERRIEKNNLYTSEAELIILDNRLDIEKAFSVQKNMTPEAKANKIKEVKENLRKDMQLKGIPDGIINEQLNSLSNKFDEEKAIRETSPESQYEFTSVYNDIVRKGGDIQTNLNAFLSSQYDIMTYRGHQALVAQFETLKQIKGSTQAKAAVEAIKKEITRQLGSQSTLDLKNSSALVAIYDEIDNLILSNPDIAKSTPKEIYDFILENRKNGRNVQVGVTPEGAPRMQILPEYGELSVKYENSVTPASIVTANPADNSMTITINGQIYTQTGGN